MPGFALEQAEAPTFGDLSPATFDPEPTGFWGTVGAAFADQTANRNPGGREEALRAALVARHAEIERRTGQRLPASFSMMIDPVDAPSARGAQVMAGVAVPDVDYQRRLDQLRREHPEAMASIDTDAQLQAKVDQALKAVRGRAAQAAAEHPVASFLGAAGGGFGDPLNLGLSVLPLGFGRTVASRILLAGAANAGIETAEVPPRLADADRIGPAYSAGEAGADVVTAGLGGLLLGGAVEGLGGLLKLTPGLKGAVAHDPAARRAADVVDQAARDDAAIGPVDPVAHEDGLAALSRGEPLPTQEPAQELGDLFGETEAAAAAPRSGPGLTGEATYRGRKIYPGSFDPAELAVDAERFQFKADADAQGVTARLRGVEQWDPTSSGKVLVWEDRAGRRFVADGHQRRALASRLEGQGFDARLDGYLFREADGWTARQVRTLAALKNIREGSGTILDAAKIFRDDPALLGDRSLPITGEFISRARALARLSPEAFGAVVNKVIPEPYAAEIGAMAGARPDLHAALVRLVHQAKPASLEETRALVSEAMLDDWVKAEGEQADMFGGLPAESTTIARAKVKAAVLAALRRDAKIYGQLVKHADAIEAGGNVLLRDANEAAAAVTRTALEVLSRLSLRAGEVGEAVAKAAAEVMDGKRPHDAARGLIQMVKNRIAAGEALDDFRATAIDPKPPAEASAALLAKVDDPKAWARQAEPAPEDAALEATPGLFDDLDEAVQAEAAADEAHQLLIQCAPGGGGE
jgi:hypothetical protein